MADHPSPNGGHATFARQVLDRLTAMKLRVGSLRLHLSRSTITLEEIEAHLTDIEQEIDATAALAEAVHAKRQDSG